MSAVELRHEESLCRLQNLVGTLEFSSLGPQLAELFGGIAGGPRALAGIDLIPPHPVQHRLRAADPKLVSDRLDRRPLRPVLVTHLGDHPRRPPMHCDAAAAVTSEPARGLKS